MTSGTAFKDLISQELARAAVKGLVTKTAVDASKDVDYVCMGTVIQEGAFRFAASSCKPVVVARVPLRVCRRLSFTSEHASDAVRGIGTAHLAAARPCARS